MLFCNVQARQCALVDHPGYFIRSVFKTPSEAQGLRCRPPVNAHILHVCCAFPIGLRLALEPDLEF